MARKVDPTRKAILQTLRYDSHAPWRDRENCSSLIGTLEIAEHSRAIEVINSEEFRSWLSAATSEVLLINGHSPSSEIDGALPLISAKVLNTLQVVEPAITVHYFCGLHQAQDDPLTFSKGMMNSMLGQLLHQRKYAFDLSVLTTGQLEELREVDLKDMCNIFGTLIG